MATVTNNAVTIWDCETTTGAVGNKPALEVEIIKENLNSVDFTTTDTNTVAGYNGAGIPATLTTASHIRIWYTSITFPNMAIKTEGGVCFYITDGVNTAYWYIAGKDTYTGGWLNIVINLGITPDYGTLPVLANVNEMGVVHGENGSSTLNLNYSTRPKNAINVWIDYLRYGDGLLAYGSPEFGIDTLALADQAQGAGYGVIETVNDTHFIYGSIEYGRTSEQTIYNDESELIVFAKANVSSTLYGFAFIGDTAVSSTFRVANCVISSAGERFYLDLDDSNIANLEFTGNTISHASTIHFLASNTLTDISSNSFNDIVNMYIQGCNFQNNTIKESGVVFIVVGGTFNQNTISNHLTTGVSTTSLDLITNGVFNSGGTGYAVDRGIVSVDTSESWDNITSDYASTDGSTGNETILVSVEDGITLTINVATGKTTPTIHNTGLGTVVVLSGQVTLTLSGHPETATLIIYDLDNADPQNLGTELARLNSANLIETFQYTGAKANDDIQVKALKNTYKTFTKPYVLPVTDSTFNTTMEKETN